MYKTEGERVRQINSTDSKIYWQNSWIFMDFALQGSKLILFLSRFLETIWSKKVAKCKMWVAKIGKKRNYFFLGDTLCKIS